MNCSAPLPPLTSTVSTSTPPSLRSVSSPGFQIIRSLPLWPKAWSSASPPVSVSLPPPPVSVSKPPLPRMVSLPRWPASVSLPAPPVSVSLPQPPDRFARGSAPFASLRVRVSAPATARDGDPDACWRPLGVPPLTGTAPPFTRMTPAALRLITMLLGWASPTTVRTPLAKVAVVAASATSATEAAPTTPAPATAPMRSRPRLRRRGVLEDEDIVVSVSSPRPMSGRPSGASTGSDGERFAYVALFTASRVDAPRDRRNGSHPFGTLGRTGSLACSAPRRPRCHRARRAADAGHRT